MSEVIAYNYGVPSGWMIIDFNKACDKVSLNKIKVQQKEYFAEGKYPIIDQGQDLIGGYYDNEAFVVSQEPPYIVFGDHTKVKKYINFKFIAGADGIKVLKPKNYFNPKLLFYFLHVIKLPDKGYARHFQFLEKSEIPFPPLPEQHRIVAKIEELFSELDKCVEALKTAQLQLKVYRQAVLKWAFEGKLTNKNVIEGRLPQGWGKVKFIEFCKLQRGYDLPLKNISKGKFPVVTSSGVHGYHNEFKANGPCLITGRSGGVGNVHYLDVEKYWPHNTVLFVKDFCNNYPKYVYYFFLQFNFKGFSASTTIPTLDRKQLYNELLYIPHLPEQHAIVAEIETRLSVADKLEETITHSLQQAEALRQSILKKAFEGKLVPQDSNDEPAEKLLERIMAEKAEQTPDKKTRKKRATS